MQLDPQVAPLSQHSLVQKDEAPVLETLVIGFPIHAPDDGMIRVEFKHGFGVRNLLTGLLQQAFQMRTHGAILDHHTGR